MSFRKKGRNFRPISGKTFPEFSGKILITEDDTFKSVISKTLRDVFGGNGEAVKSLMRITGVGERTARNWLEGKNAPNGENLIELAHHSDEVLEAFLLMTGHHEILTIKKLINARGALVKIIRLIDELVTTDLDEP
ncbi:hypothetical protein [Magnetovibrio blakemorei]|uniref:Uncharacterized protein n=1 Tax=Magnetovibrio blakemorei TaxID=28181 RepID=A0A1E5Q5Q0_9PROT|nr:hypothetical protein [Magnetovibrio blakemorei]OEJ65493.1 hypothetical protein BEN30_14215 [Magnetovibrio blakemorei]